MQRGPSISILGVSYILILSGKGARYPFPLSLTLTVTRSSLQLGTVTKQLSYDRCFPNGCRQVHHPLPSCAAFAFMPPSSMSSMILSVNSQETIPGEVRYIPSSFELSIRFSPLRPQGSDARLPYYPRMTPGAPRTTCPFPGDLDSRGFQAGARLLSTSVVPNTTRCCPGRLHLRRV